MSTNDQAKQLNPAGWFLEEERATERALNHMRHVFGTFQTEKNTTYSFMEGYQAGLRAMYRKFEEMPPPNYDPKEREKIVKNVLFGHDHDEKTAYITPPKGETT